jgi:hypothetical protein
MKVFKIPKASEKANQKSGCVIGIIDASGSMQNVWTWLADFWNKCIPKDDLHTITFDTISRVCANNTLDTTISKHGGGGTNITVAFEAFEAKLKTLPLGSHVTALFISDGQDNHLNTLETRFSKLNGNPGHIINFVCLGVGAGFPTFISMKLRELYHNGQGDLPAIFLIEYPSEKAFFNKFESMRQYFAHNSQVKVHPAVCVFPWQEYTDKVYENTWVLTDHKEIEVDGKVIDLSTKDFLQLEGVCDLWRGWVQAIHLESLKGDVKDKALKTLKLMEEMIELIKKQKNVDILKVKDLDPSEEGLTFGQRAFRNYLKYNVQRGEWYYEEFKLLAEGKSPKDLNEFDAAKRIGIGTITGKYHQKALALKGITIDDFKKLRDEFEDIYKQTTLTPQSSQEGSIFTLQNQKEVFMQKDFVDGLRMCSSQFDLVGTFPLIGLAIKIKRYNGSMVNPWLTEVRFIAKHHKVVDTVSIIKNNNALALKTGENTVENINAVLPLFGKEDADLKPLITSKIYHLLMTFNVMQNVDTLYDDAYLALLSNTLLYLLEETDTQWKDDLLKLIDATVRMTYYDSKDFVKYREALLKDAPEAIENDEEQKKYGAIDLSKAVLHLFFLAKDKLIDEYTTKEIIEAIFLKWIYSIVKNKDVKMGDYLKIKAVSKSVESVITTVKEQFKKFKTMGDLRRCVYDTMEKTLGSLDLYEYEWDFTELSKLDDKVNLKNLEALHELFLGAKPTKEDLINWMARAYVAKGYDELFKPASKNTDVSAVTGSIAKTLIVSVQKGGIKQLPQCRDAIEILEKEFSNWFAGVHKYIFPISETQLKKHCEEHKTDYKKYQFLENSGLFRNACLAPECPFYLTINNSVGHHFAIWSGNVPLGFHRTVKKHLNETPAEIYDKFEKGVETKSHTAQFELSKFGVTKEFVLDYIAKVQDVYKKIKST